MRIMKIALIANEAFLSNPILSAAARRGWETTVLDRDLSPLVEEAGLPGGAEFDALIDVESRSATAVRRVHAAVGSRVQRYILLSDASVYDDPFATQLSESEPCGSRAEGRGLAKAERSAVECFGDERVLVLRAGWVVGALDPARRIDVWIERIRRQGLVLAPLPKADRLQWVDVRDLAAWMLTSLEAGRSGIDNLVGPSDEASMDRLIDEVRVQAQGKADVTWVDPSFLLEHGVRPDRDLPFWIPDCSGRSRVRLDGSRAAEAGFAARPMAETVRYALQGSESGVRVPDAISGLAPDREAHLIGCWKQLVNGAPALAPTGREI
jgi:nucleoside-diphosphate-sugar epimerase